MEIFYVYRIRNKLNGQLYFGKGKENRCNEHFKDALRKYDKRELLIVSAIRSHGVENFETSVLFDGLLEHEALMLEIQMIFRYRTNRCREYEPGFFGIGYNRNDGGLGVSGRPPWNKGTSATAQSKLNMRNSHLGVKRPDIALLHAAGRYSNAGMRNRKHAAQSKDRLREANYLPGTKRLLNEIDSVCVRIFNGEPRKLIALEYGIAVDILYRCVGKHAKTLGIKLPYSREKRS